MKYILYARKSSESDERQIQSIDDQISYWKNRATGMGDIEISHIFIEEKSAKAPFVRPEFQKMIIELEKGGTNGVLVWKLDRLTRNPVDTGTIQFILQRRRISKIITSDREYYPEDAGLIFSVETGMATQYIMDLAKNTKRGMQGKAERGGWGHIAVQGYLNDKLERTVIVDPERFSIVRRMWDMFLSGNHSVSKICDIANNEWGYRTFKRKKIGGKKLSKSSLYTIFQNSFYMGYISHNGKLIKGTHTPMITEEEFERAQELFGKNIKKTIQTERPSKKEFPFTGTIVCGGCGCMITAEKKIKKLASGGSTEHIYYHCTHKKNSRNFKCDQIKNTTQKEIERQICNILSEITIHDDFLNWAKDVLNKKRESESKEGEVILQNINRTIKQEEERKKRLTDMFLSGMLNMEECQTKSTEIENSLVILRGKKLNAEMESKNSFELTEQIFNFAANSQRSFELGDLETKKTIFRSLGSNWILTGQKLSVDKHPWFLPLVNSTNTKTDDFEGLELCKKGISLRETNAFSDRILIWLPKPDSNRRPIG